MNKSINPFELPEYLVFLILGHIKELRKLNPDHILVKAVEDVIIENENLDAPENLDLFGR